MDNGRFALLGSGGVSRSDDDDSDPDSVPDSESEEPVSEFDRDDDDDDDDEEVDSVPDSEFSAADDAMVNQLLGRKMLKVRAYIFGHQVLSADNRKFACKNPSWEIKRQKHQRPLL